MKIFSTIALVLLLVSPTLAQVTTPNLNLQLPPHNYKQWDVPMNANSLIIDQLFVMGSCGVGDATKTMFYDSSLKRFGCQTVSGGGGGGSSVFSAILSGTNTATLLMGTGGSLDVTGTGTINSTSLLGNTWQVPGAIGSTTPNTGVFTNLTVTGTCIGCGGGSASPPFNVVTAGTNTSALLIGSGGSLGVAGSGTIDSTTLLGMTWTIPGTIGSITPNSGAFTSLSSTTTGTFNNLTVTGVCTGCSGSTTAFGSITSGTSSGALLISGSLGVTGSGTISATSFLGLTAGTSGGVPYFSSGSTLASSAALTANLPVIGGGAGAPPSVGTRTGNTTQFPTWAGATTASRCVDTDASGNLKVSTADCNVGTVIFVAETFTGGLISVSGSPISSSGTLGLTVAGVSGGIPYFSSGSTWASSAALTANSLIKGGGIGVAPSSSVVTEVGGILSTGTDFVSIAPVGLSANGALSVSPTNIGTIAGNFNCANGLTVDCFDVSIGGSKQIFVDKNGTLNLGSSLNTQPELIFASGPAPSDCNGTPPYPCIGGQWFVGPQMQYQDTNNTTQTYIVSNLNNILVGAQTFRASGPGDVPFTGQTAANPTVNGWQILDSNGVPQAYLCTSTAQANCTVPFTLFAAGFQVLGPAGVATIIGYSAGTSPGILSNKVGRIGPAVLTGTGYNVAEPGVEPTAGQVQTIVGCTAHDCTSSYQTPSGGGGGGTPGGSPGNLQYNNAGAFGGFTDGSSTQVLHGGRTFGLVVNADIAAATIDLSTKVTGLLPAADMPALTGDCTTIAGAVNITCANLNGIAYSATAAAHSVEVITTANTTATAKVIPDCTDSAGNHLNYTQSGDTFSCGTSSSGGGGGGTGVGRFSGVIDFPSIPDGACSAQTFTATGTATSDVVTVGWPSALNAGLVGNMFVSASNTITVRLCNLSGAAIDPASLTYKATLAVYNLSGSGTIDFASIPDGGCLSNTFTLTGTAAGDPVVPGWPSTLNTGLFGSMIASATDTIQVRLCNLSGAAIDPASLVYKASIAK